MSHIQNTIRKYIVSDRMTGRTECSVFHMRCFVGMIETGDATYEDFKAVGGIVLVAAVAKAKQNLDDIRDEECRRGLEDANNLYWG